MCVNNIQDFDTMLVNELVAESKAPCLAFFTITFITLHLLSDSPLLMEGSTLPPQQPQLLPPACF